MIYSCSNIFSIHQIFDEVQSDQPPVWTDTDTEFKQNYQLSSGLNTPALNTPTPSEYTKF